eukprot:2208533-Rhodomonas_salina.1
MRYVDTGHRVPCKSEREREREREGGRTTRYVNTGHGIEHPTLSRYQTPYLASHVLIPAPAPHR